MNSNSIFSNRQEFSFSSLISKDLIDHLCSDVKRFRVFDPSSTLFCFLYQVINSCSTKTALLNLNLHRVNNKMKKISMNTAAITKAKKRLDSSKLKYIACKLGQREDKKMNCWKFKQRDVFLGDGTVINLEDTKNIKEKFPVSKRKRVQHGLPKMRFFCLFSASSGSFINGKIGKYCGKGQAETSLLKALLQEIKAESILVLDRFFTNHILRKMIVNSNKNYVIRARDNAAKKVLKRKKEQIIKCAKSKHNVRYIKSCYKRNGYRSAVTYIMTNLLLEDGFSKEDIELLYLKRWSVEVDIRHLKQTLGASLLRSKGSEMVEKEIWVRLIAFNLVRALSSSNCSSNQKEPRRQSFRIYLEILLKVFNGVLRSGSERFVEILKGEVLNSPYRREPRAVRRNLKRYETMNMPRKEAKKLKWGKSGRAHRKGLRSLDEV